jgi:uncharacterized membrane protein
LPGFLKVSLVRAIRWLPLALLFLAYPLAAHYSTLPEAAARFPWLGVAMAIGPIAGLALWMAWHTRLRLVWLVLWMLACLALGKFWYVLVAHFTWVYFAQHAGANLLLAVAFGVTLRQGHEPMCSRFARAIRGELNAESVIYTRQVTQAWTVYFVAMAVVSTVLFLFAPLQIWSVFANFLTLPLAALMFIVEHRVRLRRLPDYAGSRIIDSVLAYWRDAQTRTPPKAS